MGTRGFHHIGLGDVIRALDRRRSQAQVAYLGSGVREPYEEVSGVVASEIQLLGDGPRLDTRRGV